MNDQSIPQKTCDKCGQVFPRTSQFFTVRSDSKDGFRNTCTACRVAINRAHRKANNEAFVEKNRAYRQRSQDRIREYRITNYEYELRKRRQYYEENREKSLEYSKEYREKNLEKVRASQREYAKKNADIFRVLANKRQKRMINLPFHFTPKDWENCMMYFNNSCAACGKSFQDVKAHLDHWFPVAGPNCPGTIVTNIICLCQSCNCSKHNTQPDVWLVKKFGKEKALEILYRVNQYFQSLI